ncbi:MAG: helix-turn-helix transcriptional regulator [Brachymonas sp.]|nr:helix-turn-helix transcriptional regulator [Brachymonas sp.]
MIDAQSTPTSKLPLVNSPAELGEIFRLERKALDLSQADVAAKVGCRRQTIADLEAGKNVTSLVLFKALGVIGKQLQVCAVGLDLENVRDFLGEDWDA